MLLAGPFTPTSMDFVEIFNVSLDLSTIYFAHFSRCSASFVYICHSILECYDPFSGVMLSISLFQLSKPEKRGSSNSASEIFHLHHQNISPKYSGLNRVKPQLSVEHDISLTPDQL